MSERNYLLKVKLLYQMSNFQFSSEKVLNKTIRMILSLMAES